MDDNITSQPGYVKRCLQAFSSGQSIALNEDEQMQFMHDLDASYYALMVMKKAFEALAKREREDKQKRQPEIDRLSHQFKQLENQNQNQKPWQQPDLFEGLISDVWS